MLAPSAVFSSRVLLVHDSHATPTFSRLLAPVIAHQSIPSPCLPRLRGLQFRPAPLVSQQKRSAGSSLVGADTRGIKGSREEKKAAVAMAGGGFFDLEKQFAFYGAYHTNKMNVLIHMVFVWPILFTAMLLLAYTQPLAPQLPVMAALPYHDYMVLNFSFVFAAVYSLFYVSLEPKSGSLAALLVLVCWLGANAVAQHVPWVSGWKIVAIAQVVSWSAQFTGHGFFEGRAPALLDNLAQAVLMAPYFVLLEVLHTVFHFEPYPGFNKNVQNKVGVNVAEFRSKKAKAKRKE